MNQFKKTYHMFKDALDGLNLEYQTYPDWMFIPDEFKVAAIYVRFYREIILAWSKTEKPFIEEETAISTLMQYLIKNIPLIKLYPKRYIENYLYKVAFNAFYPLGRIKRDIENYTRRVSTYQRIETKFISDEYDEEKSDNIHYINNFISEDPDIYDFEEKQALWSEIEKLNDDEKKALEKYINKDRIGKRDSIIARGVIEKLSYTLNFLSRTANIYSLAE